MLSEILSWSADRPLWQRVALRDLLLKSSLDSDDVEELAALCRHEDDEKAVEVLKRRLPLSAVDIPQAVREQVSVIITSISDVRNVNAIESGKTLSFAPVGISVVYGDNGSGKSGYIRILKKLCRARASGERILPNVFSAGPHGPASAKVEFQPNESNEPFEWFDGQVGPELLSNICVFDSKCAVVHLEEEVKLSFTPFGLDVLPKLAELCRRLRAGIDSDKARLESQKADTIRNPGIDPNTTVSKELQKLSADSDAARICESLKLSDEDRTRLSFLRRRERDDPLRRSQKLTHLQTRVRRLKDRISAISIVLTTDRIRNLSETCTIVPQLREAVKVAAQREFGKEPLAGIGSETWKELWKAAEKFAVDEAYRGQQFPLTGEAARCVLCLQQLQPDATARFTRFQQFVSDDITTRLRNAERNLSSTQQLIDGLEIEVAGDDELLAELQEENDSLAIQVRALLHSAANIRRQVLAAVNAAPGAAEWPVEGFRVDGISGQVETYVAHLAAEAEALRTELDESERTRLQAERLELEAKEWLESRVAEVVSEVRRLARLRELDTANERTDTAPITRKSTSLARQAVTEPLRTAFTELVTKEFGLTHPPMELVETRGEYGQQHYQIKFIGQPEQDVGSILSEGEHRCLSLAGFISELSTSESNSAIILDDPVSSLDHKWRRKVARLLAKQAEIRQVIVFTHDLVFLLMLEKEAEANGCQIHVQEIRRFMKNNAGIPTDRRPAPAMRVKDHLKTLEVELLELRKLAKNGQQEAYEQGVKSIYGGIREAWERAVEEVLFDGVVERYGYEIHTKKLQGLVGDFTDSDIEAINKGMTESSRILRGHADAPAQNEPIPDPDEVQMAISNLREWVSAKRKAREKQTAKSAAT